MPVRQQRYHRIGQWAVPVPTHAPQTTWYGPHVPRVVHYACDVGSTRLGRFGWARVERVSPGLDVRASSSIDILVRSIQGDLGSGDTAVTIGIECPLFLPVPDDAADLGRGRTGEGDRSCFAPAGGYVATLGLHQFAFILRRVKSKGVKATLGWKRWAPRHAVVLVWEAFVSGPAHSRADDAGGHLRDAATAAVCFEDAVAAARLGGNPVRVPDGTSPPLSLAGLVLVWSGWSKDLRLLSQEALVVRPETPYSGNITSAP